MAAAVQAQHSKLLDVCAARRQALPPALDRLLDLEAEMELRAALRGWRLVAMKQVRAPNVETGEVTGREDRERGLPGAIVQSPLTD